VFCAHPASSPTLSTAGRRSSRPSRVFSAVVKPGATICANATIICGSTIGEYAYRAGAMVRGEVAPYALVVECLPAASAG